MDVSEQSLVKFSDIFSALSNILSKEKMPMFQVTKIAAELLNEEVENINDFDKRESEASITKEEFIRQF